MALMHVNYFSRTLFENTDLYVIVPTYDSTDLSQGKSEGRRADGRKIPVLYLLHGIYGDASDWVRNTGIERYAQAADIAVVMPSARNSFYTDMSHGSRYYTYISEEVPQFAETMFPISSKREDKYIAGLSMGGFGAFKIALAAPDKFSYAASLSGALAVEPLYQMAVQKNLFPGSVKDVWESADDIRSTENDLLYSYSRLKEKGQTAPKLFQACGTEDPLYQMNVNMRDAFKAYGADLTWHEEHGAHEWDFWDRNIRTVIQWLNEDEK